MRAAIAGGHGKIGLRLTSLLSDRRDEVISLVCNPDYAMISIMAPAHQTAGERLAGG